MLSIALNEAEETELKDIPEVLRVLLKILSMIVVARVPPSVMARLINDTILAIASGWYAIPCNVPIFHLVFHIAYVGVGVGVEALPGIKRSPVPTPVNPSIP
jgi:hypothetical protein